MTERDAGSVIAAQGGAREVQPKVQHTHNAICAPRATTAHGRQDQYAEFASLSYTGLSKGGRSLPSACTAQERSQAQSGRRRAHAPPSREQFVMPSISCPPRQSHWRMKAGKAARQMSLGESQPQAHPRARQGRSAARAPLMAWRRCPCHRTRTARGETGPTRGRLLWGPGQRAPHGCGGRL